MKVFLINLKKNADRLLQSKKRLDELGVAFERVEAIYGKDLSPEEKRRSVNKFRWWCAQGRKIREGEIGCALSHYKIYRRMIADKIDYACILEDDNLYEDNFKYVLDNVDKLIDPCKPQVILLSNKVNKTVNVSKTVSQTDVTIVAAKRDMGAYSYVLTSLAAKNILNANFPMHVPCDYWLRWVRLGLINLYNAIPTVCHPCPMNQYGSDIEIGSVQRVSDYGIVRLLLHKAKRLIGCAIDSLIPVQCKEGR